MNVRSELARLWRLRSLRVWWRTFPWRPVAPVPEEKAASPDAVDYFYRAMATAPVRHTPSPCFVEPVIHEGAEGWRVSELRPLPALTPEAKVAIMTDTGEFDIVADLAEEELPPEAYCDPGEEPLWPERGEPRSLSAMQDELGEWDPDAVDWLAPAIFREVAMRALSTGALTAPVTEAEFVDAVMERVLTAL
jgi:hypothetical protein